MKIGEQGYRVISKNGSFHNENRSNHRRKITNDFHGGATFDWVEEAVVGKVG